MNRQLALQLVKPQPPRVGLFVRPGWSDHLLLEQLLVEGHAPTGFVLEGRLGDRTNNLLEAGLDGDLDVVLDTNAQELWSPAASTLAGMQSLPWSEAARAVEAGAGDGDANLAREIAGHIKTSRHSSVLAPTHYLDGPSDARLSADLQRTLRLRRELDALGLSTTRIYYPLAMPASSLSTRGDRKRVIRAIRGVDLDALWLRLHPFGTSAAGPIALRRYIELCLDLQDLGLPLVAERTGTVGVALLSFNAVGGIECGVTQGERFDAGRLLKERRASDEFARPAMVYLTAIDAYVRRRDATTILARRGARAALGCADTRCCRHGPDDMTRDARRHGVIQRIREVADTGVLPPQRRADQYMDHLRDASDLATRLVNANPELERIRKRLDSWRGTLSSLPQQDRLAAAPRAAVGERLLVVPRPRPRLLSLTDSDAYVPNRPH